MLFDSHIGQIHYSAEFGRTIRFHHLLAHFIHRNANLIAMNGGNKATKRQLIIDQYQ